MNSFILEIFDDEFPFVTYYTVRWENSETQNIKETDKFVTRFSTHDEYKEDYDEIAALLELMGNEECALPIFFTRHEDEANALPPSFVNGLSLKYGDNCLRLYCTRINDHIVVLFNGGIKTSRTAEDSPDLVSKFREARYFARKIWNEINNGMIIIDESRHLLKPFDNSEEILIY